MKLIDNSQSVNNKNVKTKFPFEHVVKYDTSEIWMECNSSITTIAIQSLVNKYYPGYTGKIGSKDYLDTLRSQLMN